MPRGGKRDGAGRHPKSLTQKILEGNPGKRKLQVLEFTGTDDTPPEPPSWLDDRGVEIFQKMVDWLRKVDCLKHIFPYHIEEYAMCKARWLDCEQKNSRHGLIAKHPITGVAIQSPYVQIAMLYLKQTDAAWHKIYEVVRERNLKDYDGTTPHDDVMERLLTIKNAGGKK